MQLNADIYRLNIPIIALMSKDASPERRLDDIGAYAVATGVPVIIICYYLAELYGDSPEIQAKITRLKLFYGVTAVKGKE